MARELNASLENGLYILYDMAYDFGGEFNETGVNFDNNRDLLEYLEDWVRYLNGNTKDIQKCIDQYRYGYNYK